MKESKLTLISSANLKIIAAVTMLLDHFAAAFMEFIPMELYALLRGIGRISALLFLFLVSEALKHTSDRRKYLMRMYFCNIIYALSFIPYSYLTGFKDTSAPSILSTYIFTITFVLIIEYILKKKIANKIYGAIMLLVIVFAIPIFYDCILDKLVAVIASALSLPRYNIFLILRSLLPDWRMVDYSILFSIMGIVFYYCKNRIHYDISLILFSVISQFGSLPFDKVFGQYSGYFSDFFTEGQWLMIMALPFILLYSGEKGKTRKSFFYLFYPIHLYLLNIFAYVVKLDNTV